MMVVIAFSLATCGAFSVSSTVEYLRDSELVRKDTELRLNIPEIFLFYIADFICAYPLFIKVT